MSRPMTIKCADCVRSYGPPKGDQVVLRARGGKHSVYVHGDIGWRLYCRAACAAVRAAKGGNK